MRFLELAPYSNLSTRETQKWFTQSRRLCLPYQKSKIEPSSDLESSICYISEFRLDNNGSQPENEFSSS